MGNINVETSAIPKIPGYPQSTGNKKESVLPCKGSASYATGGDTLTAKQCNLGPNGRIHYVSSALTNSGTYRVHAKYASNNPVASVKLVWIVVATGAEVANAVDLSAERFRVRVIGQQ